ncbi:MAG: 2-phosphoglycerate kinase [Clostridiales bacterium]|nr:2-phosphoglycerate kinase [Clostridiales bacterium]
MVILIGGNSRTGKTLMAQKLMERHAIPCMSVDHIKMGLYRGLGEEKYNPEQNDVILAENLWPVIKGIIMTAIENKQKLILEGCYILPHMVNDFTCEYLKDIFSVFIGFSENYIRRHYDDKIITFQSVIEHRGKDRLPSMENQIIKHKEFANMCYSEDVSYFQIDDDYEREMEVAYQFVEKEINRLNTKE